MEGRTLPAICRQRWRGTLETKAEGKIFLGILRHLGHHNIAGKLYAVKGEGDRTNDTGPMIRMQHEVGVLRWLHTSILKNSSPQDN